MLTQRFTREPEGFLWLAVATPVVLIALLPLIPPAEDDLLRAREFFSSDSIEAQLRLTERIGWARVLARVATLATLALFMTPRVRSWVEQAAHGRWLLEAVLIVFAVHLANVAIDSCARSLFDGAWAERLLERVAPSMELSKTLGKNLALLWLVRRFPTRWSLLAAVGLMFLAVYPFIRTPSLAGVPLAESVLAAHDGDVRLVLSRFGIEETEVRVRRRASSSSAASTTRDQIFLTDSLRDTPEFVPAVVAHEAAHLTLHHIWWSLVATLLGIAVVLGAQTWAARRLTATVGSAGPARVWPVLVLFALGSQHIVNVATDAAAQRREFAADAAAAEVVGTEAVIENLRFTPPGTISAPGQSWWNDVISQHPNSAARIEALRRLQHTTPPH